ncbi:MAG: diadenylate cyclase [Candidatus Micrarchaeaceae archaeon]|jgi:DNA integrity scanning protein DisA with diadenylate cyclase activity
MKHNNASSNSNTNHANLMFSKKTKEKEVLSSCMDIAFKSVQHGCLFVVDLNKKRRYDYYTKVFESIIRKDGKPLNVTNERDDPVIRHLASIDGATIIEKSGEMREFGVTLKKHHTFFGHGKRHAFALGTSKIKNIVCILASEEDKHIRLFREGICIADIDAKTRLPANTKQKVVDILDAPLSKVLIASGIATSILTLNPIPAIVTITGSSVIVSFGFDKIKKFFNKN